MAGLMKRKKIAVIGPIRDWIDRIQRTQSYEIELTSSNCSVSWRIALTLSSSSNILGVTVPERKCITFQLKSPGFRHSSARKHLRLHTCRYIIIMLSPVFWGVDNTIHWINHSPVVELCFYESFQVLGTSYSDSSEYKALIHQDMFYICSLYMYSTAHIYVNCADK